MNANLIHPIISFTGKIHLITNDQELKAAASILNSFKAFGFDTETRPSFKKGEVYKVAMLQLATETEAFVIRLHYINHFQILKNIFENPDVLKVGVAIRDDLRQLQKIFQFMPENFIELQTVAKEKNLQNMGLKGMTEEILQSTISKASKMTNWEAKELTDRQVAYAATDAWIGLKIYNKLIST
jgi:ribonuclease D